jgi:putative oxidoreductase
MQPHEATLSLVGRLMLAVLFLWAGLHKVFNPEGTQQYMAAYGLTVGTMLLYLGATVVEFGGGIALAIGHSTREAVSLLILFMVMVTGIFHTHLAEANQAIHFAKNLAITGGLFYVLAYGPGAFSVGDQVDQPTGDDMAGSRHAALTLVGRIFLAGLFLISGLNKLLDPAGTKQYMVAMGMVSATDLFYVAAIVLELGGALSLWLGWWTRVGAAALILFLVPATVLFHRTSMSFVLDATVQDQQVHMMKNLAILGGLLYVLAQGAGSLSLDGGRRSDN